MKKTIILISLIVLVFSCSTDNDKPFTFVQLCDTQLGMGGYEHDQLTFQGAVDQINELAPDFVVICGDLVHDANDSSYGDFKRIVEGLKMKYYPVPGNHDVGNIPNDTTLKYYRDLMGKDYYTFKHKGFLFIAANTQLWKVNVENESQKHDDWFKESLKDGKEHDNPIIVFGHFPLYIEDTEEEENYFNLPVIKRREILELFKQNNVYAYLSGHSHKTIINKYEKIMLVTGETTSKNFDNRPYGFRLWEIYQNTLTNSFIPLSMKNIDIKSNN